jgi:Uma2 family endonuclease
LEDTVFEPDITVVCDRSKLDDKGCNGVPDLIIEVLSPSSARHDRMVKFSEYQKAGVREYWIVYPETKTVQVCILHGSFYAVTMYADTGAAPVGVLPGCEINLSDVFEE